MVIYIPDNFEFDNWFLECWDKGIKGVPIGADFYYYILGLLTEKLTNLERRESDPDFVPLNAEMLRSSKKDYRKYLDALLNSGVLETDGQYLVGEKSTGFRFTPKYNGPFKAVNITGRALQKRIQNNKAQRLTPGKDKYPYLTKWFNEKLELKSEAFDYFENENARAVIEDEMSKLHYTNVSISKFRDQDFWYSVDSTVGRFHSNFTNLRSDFRKFIRYDHQNLISIDITNSQPYFSTLVLQPDFYYRTSDPDKFTIKQIKLPQINKPYKTFKLNPLSSPDTTPMIGKIISKLDRSEIDEYCSLVFNGTLYEYLAHQFRYHLNIPFDRNGAKLAVFKILFSKHYPKPDKKTSIFMKEFESVYDAFGILKKVDYTFLAKLLQTIESNAVLDRMCGLIAHEKPEMPIFTIHDSIVCPSGEEGYVADIMSNILSKMIGHKPHLRFKNWS